MSEDARLLTEFFASNGFREKEDFLEQFDGAFVLGRFKNSPPYVLFVSKDPEKKITIGSDEDECDFDVGDPTIDPIHAVVVYHKGFRGWTITDLGTSFGTHLDGDRITKDRSVLIPDGGKIKPGGGLTELQFYLSETLYKRMSKAGITRSMRRSKLVEDRAKATVAKQLEGSDAAAPKAAAPKADAEPEAPKADAEAPKADVEAPKADADSGD